jgi:nucleoside-diphosphate-sugar epimerase
MNILITGVGGYIGTYLFQNLRYKNIYGTYNNSSISWIKNKKNLFKADLSKKINIKNFETLDLVIHCASKSPFHKETIKNYKKNILITKNIIIFSKLNNIKNIIFLSTNSIYENINLNKISEEKKSSKIGLYAKSKIKSEKLFINWSKENNTNLIILRLPGVIGVHSDNTFITKINKAIKNDQVIFINNLQEKFNNVINIETLKLIIKKIILSKLENKIFNIASNNPMKIINVIKLFEKKYGKKINYINKKLKTNKFIIDASKIKKKGIILPKVSSVITKYIKSNLRIKY